MRQSPIFSYNVFTDNEELEISPENADKLFWGLIHDLSIVFSFTCRSCIIRFEHTLSE